ncbi:GDP-mannose 4,6-dehydratase [Reichenbachiella sp. MSK19-1]|uniref:GDP-mannose 4,6-dehydratase n=1 Tax=Reichenbachiella sp. MSK19-1 TaxID=1897631 RepID=UPI000E6CC360|nr:GDP-mannose 4,6-dehydratase [Reichenbachiella sp. MSK19-1]RJE71721.1 hypothetical protein BGP76_06435 [Reichenbachiella sp. MSK19-1]
MVDPSKILIIGIDSFTGGHLRVFFGERGYQVFGTSIHNTDTKNTFKVNILNSTEIHDVLVKVMPDYIINLAAISFVGEPKTELFYNINVLGTEILLETIYQSGAQIKKILIPSSAVVYGTQESHILTEDMCPNPQNHYGYSKYISEQICKSYFDKLPIVVTRPFNYTGIGQGQEFLIPKVVNAFKEKQKEIELGNLYTFREYNDIRFICNTYHSLLGSSNNSEIINVCTGQSHSIDEIIEILNTIAGYEIVVSVNQHFVRKNEIVELKGDTKKLVNAIGDLNLEHSLQDTLQFMYLN